MTPQALGIALAPAIAILGFAAHWLTLDGALAASIIGAVVFGAGGIPAAVALVLFFVSGSVLSRLKVRGAWCVVRGVAGRDPGATPWPRSASPTHHAPRTTHQASEGPRTARQVLANGFWAAAGSALVPSTPLLGSAVVLGSLAAAQSDTWATEIGVRRGGEPRLVTTWARVPRGTSGAVSGIGTWGGIAGAVVLAAAGAVAGFSHRAAIAGFIGGVLGMLADSLLGATIQGKFQCDGCNERTERRRHHCGRACRTVSGWKWLDNDGVNFLATGTGGSIAALLSCWP
ncbi:MAG: DUF92 domain-containing protein [Gemmatimonadetes bacterium]|nr:DUF92 domain-containing protein [Gemmatimonadota bacterium]